MARREFRIGLGGLVASCLTVSLIMVGLMGPTASGDETAKRVVDTVKVTVEPDGSIAGIASSTISISSSGEDVKGEATDKKYDPSRDGDALPVRVRASYETADGVGGDISKTKGTSGQVRIDISVQNATGRAQEVVFDSNGIQNKRTEFVGVPLTVVASTRLVGVSPAQIVSDDDGGGTLTNGMVSTDKDGATVVQWARVLAPPVLDANATFSLVVDASDFQVPEFDISVQPGFFTDMSFDGALRTLNGQGESALIARTISTLSEVGQILGESGKALDDARQTLSGSAETIGARTVEDLKASNTEIQSSAAALSITLEGLDSQLQAELNATGSNVIGELAATTGAVRSLLGNPRAAPPTVEINGSSCRMTVRSDGNGQVRDAGNGVYGVVAGLSARLDAYSQASSQCAGTLNQVIVGSLGPDKTDSETCEKNASLTCQLWRTNALLDQTAAALADDGEEIADSLSLDTSEDAVDAMKVLQEAVASLETQMAELEDATSETDLEVPASEIEAALLAAKSSFDEVNTQMTEMHQRLINSVESTNDQEVKLLAAKEMICRASGLTLPAEDPEIDEELVPVEEPTIKKETADELIQDLFDSTCPTRVGEDDSDPIVPDEENPSLQAMGIEQREALQSLVDRTSEEPSTDNKQLRVAIEAIETHIGEASEALIALRALTETQEADELIRAELLIELREAVDALASANGDASAEVQDVYEARESLQEDITTLFEDSATKIRDSSSKALSDAADYTTAARDGVAVTTSVLLDSLSEDLSNSASRVRTQGGQSIQAVTGQVEGLNSTLGLDTAELLRESANANNAVVDSAVKDSDAASALLTEDILKVLADIGTNTDRGGGLLGLMASAGTQLGVADTKMSDSSTRMSGFQGRQRSSLDDSLLKQARMRASLVRLETMPVFPSTKDSESKPGQQRVGLYSFHLKSKKSN